MDVQRSWSGLVVSLIDTPQGARRVQASRSHRLGLHLARPVRAVCRCDGRTMSRLQRRGDVDILPAGLPGEWQDDRSTRVLIADVSPELVRVAAEGIGRDPRRVQITPRFQLRDPRLQHIGWALEAELISELPNDPLYGESLALALATYLVQQCGPAHSTPLQPAQGLTRKQLGQLDDYIDAHIDGPLSLAELANVAGLGASHFKVLFKRSTGLPVHQYVIQCRVERARSLLVHGGTITDIANRTGFSDASHMARWMRRVLGMAPSAVKRRA
jgi:AraC family transcriptional regulator